MPLLPQRTNSIAIGATAGNSIASWPAPLGRWRTGTPCAAIASANAACSPGSHGAASAVKKSATSICTRRRLRDVGEARANRRDRGAAQRVVAGADVDRECDVLRDHVDRARQHRHLADGADEPRVAFAVPLDEEHHLGGGGERVLARAHRHGPRVTGETRDAHVEARAAGDRGDDADRQSLVQQHGTLLDVRFDVGDDVLPAAVDAAPAVRIAAEVDERLPHRDAVARRSCRAIRARSVPAIALLPISVAPKRTPSSSPKPTISSVYGRRTPRSCRSLTHAIAVMMPKRPSYRPALRTLSWCEPVITTGAPGIGGLVAPDDVAERVEVRRHSRAPHEPDQVLAGLLVLRAQVRARDARRVLAEAGEVVGLAHQFGSETHAHPVVLSVTSNARQHATRRQVAAKAKPAEPVLCRSQSRADKARLRLRIMSGHEDGTKVVDVGERRPGHHRHRRARRRSRDRRCGRGCRPA